VALSGRVLIDWDWGASGIWLIGHSDSSRPLSDILSVGLLDELKAWNDSADTATASGKRVPEDQGAIETFWGRAIGLAERVQNELGLDWEVLYNARDPICWTWVRPPWEM
jgi:hypothetical protein